MEKPEPADEAFGEGEPGRCIEILLLTQDHCGFCEQARAILERLAREYRLRVTVCDLQTPEGQRLALRAGLLFPPGLFIDGEAFSYGRLSERKLHRELDRRLGSPARERPSLLPRQNTEKEGDW